MTVFHINLIRERPVPIHQRVATTWIVLAGLLVSGLTLALVIYHSLERILASRHRQRQIASEQQLFLREHPGQEEPLCQIQTQRVQLEQVAARLEISALLLEQRYPTAQVLYLLTSSLPPHVRLLTLDIPTASRNLRMDLAIPVTSNAKALDTSQQLKTWRARPEVQRHLSDIREESTRQMDWEGKPAFLVHINATIRGGS
jgi:hypothetical protein